MELIIVIGILAVLGTVSILVLNPAQLFAQARDTTRIQDLATLNSALGLYLSTIGSPDMSYGALTCGSCFVGITGTGLNCGSRHVGVLKDDVITRVVDGTGWLPVKFTDMTAFGGSPIAVLPIDPSNNANYFYSYACNDSSKTFELNAKMESDRYRCGGTDDKERTDGGNRPAAAATACNGTQPSQNEVYELGTGPTLSL